MKKTILYKTLFFCWAILALTGCDLDLQKNYDYEPSVDDPYVKVTAWEYFQDHKDMFSELIAAIEYTGLKDYYTQTDNKYTFLAFSLFLPFLVVSITIIRVLHNLRIFQDI